MPMFKPRYEASAVQLTHGGLEAFYADLILQGDGEAVQGADGFAVGVEIGIYFSRALQGTVNEDLCQSVCLEWRERMSVTDGREEGVGQTRCWARMARL